MEIVSRYDPYTKQVQFHASRARYKWFLGGFGSGKTLAGMHELIFLAQHNPQCDGLIGCPTYPMFRDNIMPLWNDWVPRQLFTYHKGEMWFEWHPTGRRIFVRSATDPDRTSGLNVGFMWLDELALVFKDRWWNILLSRLRQQGPRPGVVITSTPNGMNWLARWFRGRRDVYIKRVRTRDNPHLPPDYEANLRHTLGEELARAYLDGVIMDVMGLCWPVNTRLHGSLSLDEMRKRCTTWFGGVDWGFTNPASVVIGGTDQEGRWYVADMWYRRGRTREQIAKAAAKLFEKYQVSQFWIDHDPEGQKQMEALGLPVALADKEVESGLMMVRSLIPPREDLRPRLYVNPALEWWWREQEGYTFPEGEEEPEGQNGDHAMDATRYMIYTHSLTWAPMGGVVGSGSARTWRGY